ncbi:leucine-rich repeat-containing protein 56 [Microcaecilia unicolor]|uniref:Leucine-rich repeat-containing protein 56 n=1 Tax=Microcaecilia unicolor TaxID=1415580 RepID=A0A6P7Y283_9AMPH|nr:leucine-rich repeat-containing protein 56 [Microcaecilia unicolor]
MVMNPPRAGNVRRNWPTGQAEMERLWDPLSCALRPVTASVRVTDFGWQGLLNPKPLSKEEEEDILVDEYLSPAKLQALTAVDDLQLVTALEMCVDTRENSLGNFGAYLPNLKQLKLNNSLIMSIRDLGTTLSHLPVLLMARCGLEDLDGISSLCSLKELYLAYNNISDLSQMSMLDDLEVLDLEGNNIDDITQIHYLSLCSKLSALTLEGNHICLKPYPKASETEDYNYRAEVKKLIPHLKFLDEVPAEQTRILPSITINEDWLMVKESIKDGCAAELFSSFENDPVTGRRQANSSPRPATSLLVSASRLHGSSMPGSAGRPTSARLLSSPGTESVGSDEMSPEDEASDLTYGVSKVICGNPIKALRARREKLGPASVNYLKHLSQKSEHVYNAEALVDSHWDDVFAELRIWREKQHQRLEAIQQDRAPQVMKIIHSDEEDEEAESSCSESSNKEDKGRTSDGFLNEISPHSSSLLLSPGLLFPQESSSSLLLNSRLPTPPASPSPPSVRGPHTMSWKTKEIRMRRLKMHGQPAEAVKNQQCQSTASCEARCHLTDEEFAILDLCSAPNNSDPIVAETAVGSRIDDTQSTTSRRLITGPDSVNSALIRPDGSKSSSDVFVSHQPVIRSSAKTSERLTLLNSVHPLTSKAVLQRLPNRPTFMSLPSKTSSSS